MQNSSLISLSPNPLIYNLNKTAIFEFSTANVMSIETALRIKKIREYRNYTQQFMADSLELSQNAYCKIENGSTKLTIDRLEEIATILDVPVESILSSQNQTFNIENNTIDKLYGNIENLYEANKELMEKQIILLQQQNENLLKTIDLLSKKS